MTEASVNGTQAPGLETPESQPEDCLPFNPTGDCQWIQETFQAVPHYLFHVTTPQSQGQNTKSWAKSKDATNGRATSRRDIFSRAESHVASMLDNHLWNKAAKFDNFVSWTSSLVYAIQYIFFRHHEERTSLDKIDLYIVDTTKFSTGVFVRDIDLLAIYSPFAAGLQKLQGVRNPTPRDHPHSKLPEFLRSSYFGEYLSQGALRIEDKCSVVSAQNVLDAGLFDIRAEFRASRRFNLGLDERIKHLRKTFAQCEHMPRDIEKEIQAAAAIGKLFGPDWSLPVAASFMALRPCRGEDVQVICTKFVAIFPGPGTSIDISPAKSLPSTKFLPEVQQFDEIMLSLFKV